MAKLDGSQLHLLNRLREAKEPVSAQALANSLGVSERTVRSRLKTLGQVLQDNGATVCSKTGSGYWLEISDEEMLDDLLQDREGDTSAMAMNAVRQARAHLLVRYLLCQEEYVKAEELEDVLFMGRTAVKQLLSRARTILDRSGLELVSRNRQGMMVSGGEQDIRTCIVYEGDQIERFRIPLSAREKYAEIYDFRGEKMEQVRALVCRELGELANLSVYGVTYLARLIWVSAIRGGAGKALHYAPEEAAEAEKSMFYQPVCGLLKECGRVLEGEFSPEDAILLTTAVRGLHVVLDIGTLPREEQRRSRKAAGEVVAELVRLNRFENMGKDEELVEDIACYLAGLFIRSRHHIRTVQISKEDCAGLALMAKKLGMQAFMFLEKQYGVSISEGEILHLAMVIRPVFGRFPHRLRQVKACCISDVDKLVGRGLAQRLRRNFGKYIAELDVLEPYELGKKGGQDYEVLFTSRPLTEFRDLPDSLVRIPVEPFFDERDKQRILKTLSDIGMVGGGEITDCLRPEYIFVGVEAADQESCLTLIEEKLSAAARLRGSLKEDLLYCETNLASQPRENVVILSGLESHLPELTVAVFVLKKPIQWGSEDSKAQVVVYWDQGEAPGQGRMVENEFLPHTLERVFYDRGVAHNLLTKLDYGEILEVIQRKDQEIMTMASSF